MQIIAHIGLPKTASSFIQSRLQQNRNHLAVQGVLYPNLTEEAKADWILRPRGTPPDRVRAEFTKPFARAVLSNEGLYNYTADPDIKGRLTAEARSEGVPAYVKRTFDPFATSWRVLCYVRRPDEHIASQYQQWIKGGYVGTLTDFYHERISSDYYRYKFQMDRWAGIFGHDAVEVRLFHRQAIEVDPFEDFVRWIDIPPQSLPERGEAAVNESWDRLNTEILRFLNRCTFEWPDRAWRRRDLPTRKELRDRLEELDEGDRLRLPLKPANHLHETFRDDHEQLAKRYLTAEHAALLLAPPPEVPVKPLDRDALHARMMVLFDDPDLAQLAVETAEQSSDRLWRPRRSGSWQGTRVEHAEHRAKRKAEKQAKRQKRQQA